MPVHDFPYEILSEIFLVCLPADPLDHKQPDLSQVPLLVCHVCREWRNVALTTPTLWTHIYQSWIIPSRIHVVDILKRGIRRRDTDFLRWWLDNTTPYAPSIRLDFQHLAESSEVLDNDQCFRGLDAENLDALKRHLSQARYLDLDRLSAAAFRAHMPKITYPNLETVLIRDIPYHRERHIMHLSESLETILPINHMQPLTIRKLFLDRYHIYLPHVTTLLSWSNLTHVCLAEMTIQTPTWFVLIREFRSLQTGQFYLRMEPMQFGLPKPSTASLAQLRQLHVAWDGPTAHPHIFENLQLPSLTALRIDSYLTIAGLHVLLKSTPALKELHLGANIPWVPIADRQRRFPGPELTPERLSLQVPDLEYLLIQLDDESSLTEAKISHWVQTLLTTSWLGFGTPNNRLGRVELAIEDLEAVRQHLQDAIDHFADSRHAARVMIRGPNAPKLWTTRSSYEKKLSGCFDDMKFSEIIRTPSESEKWGRI